MNEDQYRQKIRVILNKWSIELVEALNEISHYKFYEEIDLLDFEIHHKCSIWMYTMTKDANEFYPSIKKDSLYCGSKSVLKGLDKSVYDYLYEFDDEFEEFGIDTYVTGSKEVMVWFTECWKKSNCTNIKLPIYIGIHDHSPLYDVTNEEWKESGDQWVI